MNDSLRTNVFVRFQAETIACACIYLAARALQVVLWSFPFILFLPKGLKLDLLDAVDLNPTSEGFSF